MSDDQAPRVHPNFRAATFLFKNLLQESVFAFICGNPGSSKSLVVLDIAARLTQGVAPGKLLGKPVDVIYVSTEGTFEISHGPRFFAAGGEIARLHHINRKLKLPSQIDRLAREIRQHDAKLVIIDPIDDHLDDVVFSSPKRAAEKLEFISDLAKSTGCTILGVNWPSKSLKKGDLTMPGFKAFTGVPRQTLANGRLDRVTWVIGISKANDVIMFTGWLYDIEIVDIGVDPDGESIIVPRIKWKGEASPAQVKSAHAQADIEDHPALLELLEFANDKKAHKTKVLIEFLTETQVIGQTKARKLLASFRVAGYLLMKGGLDKDGVYEVTYTITPLGVMKLAMNEEQAEAAIEELFPTLPFPDEQLGLPAARRKRVIPRTDQKRSAS